jgi:hypothetical protein
MRSQYKQPKNSQHNCMLDGCGNSLTASEGFTASPTITFTSASENCTDLAARFTFTGIQTEDQTMPRDSGSPSLNRSSDVVVGQVFGLLTVVSAPYRVRYSAKGAHYLVMVQCSCGSPEKSVKVQMLRIHRTKSCGCMKTQKHWSIMNGKSGKKEKPNG